MINSGEVNSQWRTRRVSLMWQKGLHRTHVSRVITQNPKFVHNPSSVDLPVEVTGRPLGDPSECNQASKDERARHAIYRCKSLPFACRYVHTGDRATSLETLTLPVSSPGTHYMGILLRCYLSCRLVGISHLLPVVQRGPLASLIACTTC